jgi:hypothetical protein
MRKDGYMRPIIPVFSSFCALLLSSCFESDAPFITIANADYPFGQQTHWINLVGPNQDVPGEVGDLTLRDGYYQNDKNDRYLFKAVERNFYVAQECTASMHCNYALIRLDDRVVGIYSNDCTQGIVEAFTADGTISRVEPILGTSPGACYVRDLAGLIAIFRSLENQVPQTKLRLE